MLNKEQLKSFYESLQGDFEGYIQLSDSKNFILLQNEKLPLWQTLHNAHNFIIEANFFNGDRSITIRQINASFAVLDENISHLKDTKNIEITYKSFLTQNGKKAKIAQIWEEENDALCENFSVLKPKYLLFCGFTKGNENE